MPRILNATVTDLLNVERSISELRRGGAIAVWPSSGNNTPLMILAADTVGEIILQNISDSLSTPANLLLSSKRVRALFPDKTLDYPTAKLALPTPINITDLYRLTGLDIENAPIGFDVNTITPASLLEQSALELVKLAELIPAALVLDFPASIKDIPAWLQKNNILSVKSDEIKQFKTQNADSLNEVCTAPLCLQGAEDASIRVYRPSLGGSEHYAIIIGDTLKDTSPLVRIHSSCYTGDLLRSLRCDCGDQLHEAIHFMGKKAKAAKQGDSGGIIIYLMQEGRGIGLTNKLRAYALQAKGLDTVDANETLGFDDDERLFLPAVNILKQLGLSSIRLLSNNPKKAKDLEESGIKITARVPHIMQSHQHNEAYLETKARRLGHRLPSGDE